MSSFWKVSEKHQKQNSIHPHNIEVLVGGKWQFDRLKSYMSKIHSHQSNRKNIDSYILCCNIIQYSRSVVAVCGLFLCFKDALLGFPLNKLYFCLHSV